MRLIIFSDLHGNSEALKLFLRDIEDKEYDRLVFCGDIFGYYYGQKEIIDILRSIPDLVMVKGNHDSYFVNCYEGNRDSAELIERYGHSYENLKEKFTEDEYRFVKSMPIFAEIDAEGYQIAVAHGMLENLLEGRWYPDKEALQPKLYDPYDYVLLGHTHCRMVKHIGKTKIINSGSIGQPRDGHTFGYSLLDTETGDVTFYDIHMDLTDLYREIDVQDPGLEKLKEVLNRIQK